MPTFLPVPSSGGIQSFTLESVSQGIPLFETFTDVNNNITLGLRTITGAPGISITVSQGIIYFSTNASLFPKDQSVPLGRKAFKAFKEFKEIEEFRDHQEFKEEKDHKGNRGYKEYKETKEFRDHQDQDQDQELKLLSMVQSQVSQDVLAM